MIDISARIRELTAALSRLRKSIASSAGIQVRALKLKGGSREVAHDYFRELRPYLLRIGIDLKSVDPLMQVLLELSNKNSSSSKYQSVIRNLEKELGELIVHSELKYSDYAIKGSNNLELTHVERRIVATLTDLLPMTALSYQQILSDLNDDQRVSYRGTAAELREVLRETLDQLASDSDVMSVESFKLEKDRSKPTMAQKVRYIMGLRGQAKNATDVPKKSVEIVEETVSSLVRSTYDRGSIDTHTKNGLTKAAALQLKMYVDGVLCELLEIHSRT